MSRPPRPPMPSTRPTAGGDGQVRIIGGRWRNTRLPVPRLDGLRPTGDRVRETLFNWLMPVLPGARVLDLFAGSGALGLEAVSRGASTAQLVERDPARAAALGEVVARLQAGAQVQVAADDALHWLERAPAFGADIVFIDPPFAAGLWTQALQRLPRHLADDAWLYLEVAAGGLPFALPGWSPHRQGTTREVGYALYRRAAATLGNDLNATPSA
ncbi:16S rRNA (guanine(966)-N(2))-methyltransferase RsmD [Stenotrophomonas mori]|uniref:Ribosomal RNA small subunit methyltransferase D n=1 Tax=Stenotrophomonas mori TaxID=2871096 RepID=A0ABT0SF81_9GAMM|nr:16S rRNA (guanine(966)-N(2))-methyltransferase RsmD [Stenotrophomonas mori]MCL7713743.1 16S rRNA (guanine(966)-N(2))-methyltransferase RsmD [Stenotrophomonas mori]